MKSILRAINDKRAGVQHVVTKSGSLITNDSDKTDGLYSQKWEMVTVTNSNGVWALWYVWWLSSFICCETENWKGAHDCEVNIWERYQPGQVSRESLLGALIPDENITQHIMCLAWNWNRKCRNLCSEVFPINVGFRSNCYRSIVTVPGRGVKRVCGNKFSSFKSQQPEW